MGEKKKDLPTLIPVLEVSKSYDTGSALTLVRLHPSFAALRKPHYHTGGLDRLSVAADQRIGELRWYVN